MFRSMFRVAQQHIGFCRRDRQPHLGPCAPHRAVPRRRARRTAAHRRGRLPLDRTAHDAPAPALRRTRLRRPRRGEEARLYGRDVVGPAPRGLGAARRRHDRAPRRRARRRRQHHRVARWQPRPRLRPHAPLFALRSQPRRRRDEGDRQRAPPAASASQRSPNSSLPAEPNHPTASNRRGNLTRRREQPAGAPRLIPCRFAMIDFALNCQTRARQVSESQDGQSEQDHQIVPGMSRRSPRRPSRCPRSHSRKTSRPMRMRVTGTPTKRSWPRRRDPRHVRSPPRRRPRLRRSRPSPSRNDHQSDRFDARSRHVGDDPRLQRRFGGGGGVGEGTDGDEVDAGFGVGGDGLKAYLAGGFDGRFGQGFVTDEGDEAPA